MLLINNLTMNYGAKLLFHEVSLNLTKGNRYGLVGANGSGKSTFLRLLAGEETANDGEMNVPNNTTIGILKQDQFLHENDRVIDVVIQGKKILWEAMQEKEKLLEQCTDDESVGYKLGELEEIIAHNDGYVAESLAQEILIGLGIEEKYHYQPLNVLSGGFKLRCLLAQSLFNNPDILLLDEPTNHLDIMTIAWLEKYLSNNFKGLLIFISHDLGFLNNLATHILDIDYGEVREYIGNYDKYIIQKETVMEQKLRERSNIEKKVAQMQVFVDRFRASASRSKQALSREKHIEKIELPDIEKTSRISPHFNFTIKVPSGKTVLTVEHLTKSFGDKVVLNNVKFNVTKGEKLLFIGHNGVGKSTLLKTILGKTPIDGGSYEWGYSTNISYFAQDHHEELNHHISLFDWLCEQANNVTTSDVRNMLGQVLFRKDDVYKDILDISGGEAARLLFARIMLERSNVLILDEPTNHLDIESVEALIKALHDYQGTLLFVTHDRYFASKVATRVIALTEKGIKDFHGSYDEYIERYGNDYLSRAWLKKNQ